MNIVAVSGTIRDNIELKNITNRYGDHAGYVVNFFITHIERREDESRIHSLEVIARGKKAQRIAKEFRVNDRIAIAGKLYQHLGQTVGRCYIALTDYDIVEKRETNEDFTEEV